MGSRLLRRWLHHPLRDNAPALERQRVVAAFLSAPPDMQTQGAQAPLDVLRQMLDRYPDLERIATRIALRSVRPRELASLREALALLPEVARHPDTSLSTQPRLAAFLQNNDIPPENRAPPHRATVPEPACSIHDGGVIAGGP